MNFGIEFKQREFDSIMVTTIINNVDFGVIGINNVFAKGTNRVEVGSDYSKFIGEDLYPQRHNMKIYQLSGKMYNFNKENEIIENYTNYKEYEPCDEVKYMLDFGVSSLNDVMNYQLSNKLKLSELAFVSKITTVWFDDVQCYSLEFDDPEYKGIKHIAYFEKATGILRKYDDIEYYYKFNSVNDKVFELPDIPEYLEK